MKKTGIIITILAVFTVLVLTAIMRKEVKAPINTEPMIITSPSFNNGEKISQKFTCDGGDINPELHIQNVPESAQSLALIMDDPDATRGVTFTHWLVWNISPVTALIKQESRPPGSIEGRTDFDRTGYGGPCPPTGKPHRYFFKLYALDGILDLPEGSGKAELESEINKHLIEKAELIGTYGR